LLLRSPRDREPWLARHNVSFTLDYPANMEQATVP
jgi:hypothetical protein